MANRKRLVRNIFSSRAFLLCFIVNSIQRELDWGMRNPLNKPNARKNANYVALNKIKELREHVDYYENMIREYYSDY